MPARFVAAAVTERNPCRNESFYRRQSSHQLGALFYRTEWMYLTELCMSVLGFVLYLCIYLKSLWQHFFALTHHPTHDTSQASEERVLFDCQGHKRAEEHRWGQSGGGLTTRHRWKLGGWNDGKTKDGKETAENTSKVRKWAEHHTVQVCVLLVTCTLNFLLGHILHHCIIEVKE